MYIRPNLLGLDRCRLLILAPGIFDRASRLTNQPLVEVPHFLRVLHGPCGQVGIGCRLPPQSKLQLSRRVPIVEVTGCRSLLLVVFDVLVNMCTDAFESTRQFRCLLLLVLISGTLVKFGDDTLRLLTLHQPSTEFVELLPLTLFLSDAICLCLVSHLRCQALSY